MASIGNLCNLTLSEGTHALVNFVEEDKTAVVPISRLEPRDDELVDVVWINKKRYRATLVMSGNKAECESKQDQLDEGDDTKPDSSENEKGHESRKTRKRKKIHVKQCESKEEKRTSNENEKENENPNTRKRKKSNINKQKQSDAVKPPKRDVKQKNDFHLEVGIAPERKSYTTKDDLTSQQEETETSSAPTSSTSSAPTSSEGESEACDTVISLSVDSGDDLTSDRVNPLHFTGGKKDPELLYQQMSERIGHLETSTKDVDWKCDDIRRKVLALDGTVTEMKKVLTVLLRGRKTKLSNSSSETESSPETASLGKEPLSRTELLPQMEALPRKELLGTASPLGSDASSVMSSPETASPPSSGTISPPSSGTISTPSLGTISSPASKVMASKEVICVSDDSADVLPHTVTTAETDVTSYLSDAKLMQLFLRSCSRKNFSARLSGELFDETTRKSHNVNGRGKPKLDPVKITYIKKKAFQFFPCGSDKEAVEWAQCIGAIDEYNRRLKNKPSKTKVLAELPTD